MYRLESNSIGIVDVFRRLLRYFELEYFAFFIGLDQIIASVKLIFYDRFTIFSS